MKKIYLSIVAAVSLMFVSCTADWLNTDPSTAVPSDDAIKNIDDAQVALNGIYRLASAHSYYGDNYLYYADCRGEDVQARINKGAGRRVSPYYFFDVTADDNFNITLVWNQPYKVIHQANSLIEKLDAGNAGNARPEEVLVVGDRLYTDIACGINAGVQTALVYTGEAKPEDLKETEYMPDYAFADIRTLLQAFKRAKGE